MLSDDKEGKCDAAIACVGDVTIMFGLSFVSRMSAGNDNGTAGATSQGQARKKKKKTGVLEPYLQHDVKRGRK